VCCFFCIMISSPKVPLAPVSLLWVARAGPTLAAPPPEQCHQHNPGGPLGWWWQGTRLSPPLFPLLFTAKSRADAALGSSRRSLAVSSCPPGFVWWWLSFLGCRKVAVSWSLAGPHCGRRPWPWRCATMAEVAAPP
jgi:hypothetical protein